MYGQQWVGLRLYAQRLCATKDVQVYLLRSRKALYLLTRDCVVQFAEDLGMNPRAISPLISVPLEDGEVVPGNVRLSSQFMAHVATVIEAIQSVTPRRPAVLTEWVQKRRTGARSRVEEYRLFTSETEQWKWLVPERTLGALLPAFPQASYVEMPILENGSTAPLMVFGIGSRGLAAVKVHALKRPGGTRWEDTASAF